MQVAGVAFEFEPGSTFKKIRGESPEAGMRDPDPDERHSAREEAVRKFQANAVKATQGQIVQVATTVVGLCIQLRALGGSFQDTGIKDQLREIVDFMEDL